MTKTNILIFAGMYAILATSTVLAKDIYKYTDDDGTIHYVDRPTGAPAEERVSIASSRPSSSTSEEASGPDWRERRQARIDARDAAKSAKSEEEERKRICNEYRMRLDQYSQSDQLYRMDEQGERVYLNDTEVAEARKAIQDRIQEHCSA